MMKAYKDCRGRCVCYADAETGLINHEYRHEKTSTYIPIGGTYRIERDNTVTNPDTGQPSGIQERKLQDRLILYFRRAMDGQERTTRMVQSWPFLFPDIGRGHGYRKSLRVPGTPS